MTIDGDSTLAGYTKPEGAGPELSGRRIGPYRVVRELGRGGMGAVYLARRDDAAFDKQVALKLVRLGGGDELVQRFRRERQILAGLEHPNIARLLDGGTADDGTPYLVMEYVDGQPIDRWCDGKGLGESERLKLFRKVCEAVQHAHARLVVHRDLKPSNILVTPDGTPKLLDFGIAKLVGPAEAQELTSTGIVMTPEYASPEQARGEPLTTASDVYTLGVVLYELLAGCRPYRVKPGAPLDVLRAVLEQEPLAPSVAVGGGRTVDPEAPTVERSAPSPGVSQVKRRRRRLEGDLDNIVLRALAKEPERRYASAEALSEDIRRHLVGLPVLARPATFGYRASRFLRRHRVGVAAAVVVGAMTAAFVGVLMKQSARLQDERDRARFERDRAERVSTFLVDLFKESDPEESRGRPLTAREVLDGGARKLKDELRDDPGMRATLLTTIGSVYTSLSELEAAGPMLKEAVELRRRSLGDHADTVAALTSLGEWMSEAGETAAAEKTFAEALEMSRRVHPGDHAQTASALNDLGATVADAGRLDEALALHGEGLAMHRRLGAHASRELAIVLSNVGFVHYQKADYAEAARLFEQSLAMNRQVLGPDHPLVATTLNNYANAVFQGGDLRRALPLMREAVALDRKVRGPEHPDVARDLRNVGNLLQQLDDDAGAEAAYRESLAIRRKALGPGHPDVARSLATLASALDGRDDAQAERLAREAIGWPTPLPAIVEAEARLVLARVLARRGRGREALEAAQRGLDLRRQALPAGHWAITVAERDVAVATIAAGRRAEGVALLEKAHAQLVTQIGAARRETRNAAAALSAAR